MTTAAVLQSGGAGGRSVCDKGAPALACWGGGFHAPAATRFYSYQLFTNNRLDEPADIGTAVSGSANGAQRRIGDVLKATSRCCPPLVLHTKASFKMHMSRLA